MATARTGIEIGLTAAIVSVDGDEPLILVASGSKGEPRAGLPSGPFDPLEHHTFEIGLRAWVKAQTALSVGYVEQLYTFGDRGRAPRAVDKGPHGVSIGYLAIRRRRLRAVVPIFSVGRLARWATRDYRRRGRTGADRVGIAKGSWRTAPPARPQGTIAAQFRARRRTVG